MQISRSKEVECYALAMLFPTMVGGLYFVVTKKCDLILLWGYPWLVCHLTRAGAKEKCSNFLKIFLLKMIDLE